MKELSNTVRRYIRYKFKSCMYVIRMHGATLRGWMVQYVTHYLTPFFVMFSSFSWCRLKCPPHPPLFFFCLPSCPEKSKVFLHLNTKVLYNLLCSFYLLIPSVHWWSFFTSCFTQEWMLKQLIHWESLVWLFMKHSLEKLVKAKFQQAGIIWEFLGRVPCKGDKIKIKTWK